MVSRRRISSSTPSSVGGGGVIIPAGDSDAIVDTGTQTETMVPNAETTLDHGADTGEMGFTPKPELSTGTDTNTFAGADASAVSTITQGTSTSNHDGASQVTTTRPTGTGTDSFQSDADANITQYTTTTTVSTSNTPAWTSPTNAEGDFDGAEANHGGFGGVGDTNGFNSNLVCSGLVVPTTPPGFTPGDVTIRIRHRWDLNISLAVAGVTDVTQDIDLLDSSNALIANLSRRVASGGGSTQATLIDEDFDITAIATPAELAAGVKVDCHFYTTGTPTAAVNGNTSWNVDAVHLRTDYSRTGIA